jgi:hypothetical protein
MLCLEYKIEILRDTDVISRTDCSRSQEPSGQFMGYGWLWYYFTGRCLYDSPDYNN